MRQNILTEWQKINFDKILQSRYFEDLTFLVKVKPIRRNGEKKSRDFEKNKKVETKRFS
jgi:hypothetical protein